MVLVLVVAPFHTGGWAARGAEPPAAAPVVAGFGARDISPPRGVPLIGYPSPRPNRGVALALQARAAVFGAPGRTQPIAGLVVLDILHIDPTLAAAVRERAAASVPGLLPGALMVAATHTHSGPAVANRPDPDDESKTETGYFETVVAAAADALAEAWKDRHEVRGRVGHGAVRLGTNRRVVDAAGRATNEWRDPEGRHPGFFNPDVPFVLLEDAVVSRPTGVLLSYGCHPVTLGPKNDLVSPDYPGFARRFLESALPGAFALFVTGAAGDINPRDCLSPEADHARPMGEALARTLLDAIPGARPLTLAPVASVSVPLRLTLKPDYEKSYAARSRAEGSGRSVTSEVQVLRLGDLAFVSSPGELVSLLGVAVQNSSPFPQTMIVYNANDHLGYLVSDTIRREGGYEARSAIADDIEAPYLAAAREALASAWAIGR